ncbi:unnamed protein product [Cuscuta campestris]|uniref:Uncharacterized protein n=1 Tax=Cuscuta campestris TaxID=132261 RepID=A0A484LGV4_9ASTE|nr:unnamed protein product [Cuscuta campestris]
MSKTFAVVRLTLFPYEFHLLRPASLHLFHLLDNTRHTLSRHQSFVDEGLNERLMQSSDGNLIWEYKSWGLKSGGYLTTPSDFNWYPAPLTTTDADLLTEKRASDPNADNKPIVG